MKHVHIRISEMKYKPGNRRQNLDLHMKKGKKGIWFQSLLSRAMFSVAFNPYRNPRISGSYFVVSIVSSIEKAPVFWNSSSSWHLMIHHINLAGLSYKGRTTFLIEMAMFRLMSELWAHNRSSSAMLLRLWTKSVEECLYSPSVCQQQFFYWQPEGKGVKMVKENQK